MHVFQVKKVNVLRWYIHDDINLEKSLIQIWLYLKWKFGNLISGVKVLEWNFYILRFLQIILFFQLFFIIDILILISFWRNLTAYHDIWRGSMDWIFALISAWIFWCLTRKHCLSRKLRKNVHGRNQVKKKKT